MDDILFLRLSNIDNPDNLEWLLANSKGKMLKIDNTEINNIKHIIDSQGSNLSVFVIIPDDYVSFHVIDLPIKDRKKQLQAIPYILEDQIISEIDDTHFVIGPSVDSNRYIVAVIDKKYIEKIVQQTKETLGRYPCYVLTEAMCLYTPNLGTDKYNLYFNYPSNSLLLYNKFIVNTDLDNANIVLSEMLKNGNFTVDIFTYKIDNIAAILQDNLKNITINSEQEIDNWLAFLVTIWFNNFLSYKSKSSFNLLQGYLKPSSNLKFNRAWRHTSVILTGVISLYIGYKFLDTLWFLDLNKQLNQTIESELLSVNIINSDISNFSKVGKELSTSIEQISSEIEKNKYKNIFYIILSSYAQNSRQELELKSLNYIDNIVSLNFEINKDNVRLLDRIKDNLTNDNISVKEQIITDGKIVEYNWQLTLNQ